MQLTNPITVTLNDRPCIAATVILRTGAPPSEAAIRMTAHDAAQLPLGTVTLRLSDQSTSATVTSLHVRSISPRPDGTATVRLADRRATWTARISGEYRSQSARAIVAALLSAAGEATTLPHLMRHHEDPGVLRFNDTPVGEALATVLARIGQAPFIDADGTLRAVQTDRPATDHPLLISLSTQPTARPATLRIIPGASIRAATLTFTGDLVCRDETGAWRELADLCTEWGVDAALLAKAVLVPGGIARIVTAGTSEQNALRAGLLTRHAWRSFRIPASQSHRLPLIAVRIGSSGAATSPLIEHTGFRFRNDTSDTLADPFDASTDLRPATTNHTFDGAAGIITFESPTGHLAPLESPAHHTALEGRELIAPPTIRITVSERAAIQSQFATRPLGGAPDAGTVAITRGDLGANTADAGTAISAALNRIAALVRRALPEQTVRAKYAGAHSITPAAGASVRITASSRTGLTTLLAQDPAPITRILRAFSVADTPLPSSITIPGAQDHADSAITASRLGPLIIRADPTNAPGAALSFAEATAIDEDTGAITLDSLGRLATPFYIPSSTEGAPGIWCLAIPVRKLGASVTPLDDATTTTTDHDAQSATALGAQTPIPGGTDGILLRGLDGDSALALFDRAIVVQARGTTPGQHTTELHEITGTALDTLRHGPLHLALILAISPTHAAAGVGGTESQRGWIPVLNLRDYASGTSVDALLAGRGLFADDSGHSLGRLAHLPRQGGPIMSDADSCEKHSYGDVTHGEETFKECAGHISTGAFFKVPGDPVYDAPFHFEPEITYAHPSDGLEYRAQIKLSGDHTHPWNGTTKDGRWVVTYRLPFYDTPPDPPFDFWPPYEDPPVAFPKNIIAPSFDWTPPGGDPGSGPGEPPGGEGDIPWRAETLSSVGYAPIDGEGYPDPASGGGAFFMPRGVRLRDGTPWVYEGPRYFVTLHQGVGLAFGRPNYEDESCAPCDGVRFTMDEGGQLVVAGVDSAGDEDNARGVRIETRLTSVADTLIAVGEGASAGFFGAEPVQRQVVTGSRSGGEALESLLAALVNLGLIEDDTSS